MIIFYTYIYYKWRNWKNTYYDIISHINLKNVWMFIHYFWNNLTKYSIGQVNGLTY